MSRGDEIFQSLITGSSFNTKKFGSIAKFKKGRRSEISEILLAKKNAKPEFFPQENINFFKDQQFENVEIPKKRRKIKNNSFVEPEQTSNLTENMQKYKIRVKSTGVTIPKLITSFLELKGKYNLRDYLIRNLQSENFEKPTPVQMQGIPIMMNKIECVVAAPTGSGKTLAFVLPILSNLGKSSKEIKRKKGGFRAVVVVPTRILCEQIKKEFLKFSKGKSWTIRSLSKNTAKIQQKINSKKNDVLITTPNRLVQLIKRSQITLSTVEYLVVDEADKLFDMEGFIEQMDEIVSACSNPQIHRSLFSATVPLGVEHLAKTFLRTPITLTVGIKNSGSETISQELNYVSNENGKMVELRRILSEGLKPPILIFVNHCDRALQIYQKLMFENFRIDYITSKRNEKTMERIVENFRTGRIWALVCTDIMGRGLDVLGISCVINYDFPRTEIEYIHRIGRTGRAGNRGVAKTFVTNEDMKNLKTVTSVIERSGQVVPHEIVQIQNYYLKLESEKKSKKKRKRKD